MATPSPPARANVTCARRAVLSTLNDVQLHFFESFVTPEGAQRFLKLWGWREEERAWHTPKHALDSCPLSDRPASVIRVIRPHDQADAERSFDQAQLDQARDVEATLPEVRPPDGSPSDVSAAALAERLRQVKQFMQGQP